MSMLSEKNREQIQARLAEMEQPVRLIHFTQELNCESCEPARRLLEEVAALSDKVTLEVHNFLLEKEEGARFGIDKVPATVVAGERDHGIRLYGLPAGYGFAVLLEDILDVSRGRTGLAAETRERLQTLTTPVHLQVFTTPACPYCPAAARLAHQLALESDLVTADMIEAAEYTDLVLKYGVQGVPKTIINGVHAIEGALPEPYFVDQVLQAAGVAQTAGAQI
jgi:glutaredoxin-like protein